MNTVHGELSKEVNAYLRQITKESRHRRVGFTPAKWKKWLDGVGGLSLNLEGFEGLISREEMVELVNASLARDRAGVADAFVVTMLWGHGNSGYGPYRTHKILTQGGDSVSPVVLDALHSSVEAIRRGSHDGFWFMNNKYDDSGRPAGKIADLGPAFFTKWMYVVSAQGSPSGHHALPILDAVMQSAVKPFWGGGRPPRTGHTPDYVAYVDALKEWGGPFGASSVEVEEAIFDVSQGYSRLERFAPRQLDGVFGSDAGM